MFYVKKMELNIKWLYYCPGTMTVNLNRFLEDRKTNNFKKLLKEIRNSDTPEEEQKIIEFIDIFNDGFDDAFQQLENKKIEYSQKVDYCENVLLKMLLEIRSSYKRYSKAYKDFSHDIKVTRNELRSLKTRLNNTEKAISDLRKDKIFISKVKLLLSE